MLTDTQKQMLAEKLDAKHVKQKPTGFKASYIEGWHAIAEANNIFGFDGWHSEVIELRLVGEEQTNKGWKVGYLAKVKITVTGEDGMDIVREGVGFGNGEGPSKVDAHELAAKEAETDSRKRALMTFGWPFGLALYDKTQEHVEKDDPKKPSGFGGPIADGVEIEGNGQRSELSANAVALGNALTQARNLTELTAIFGREWPLIKGWHKSEKDHVKKSYDERKAALAKFNPEMVA